ncbi:MAG: hypothetical protein CM1200mP41_12340 [Gammaproteobacteria bacterium]|nr:MAG: hypothetical protein CM1200mP41_12340 [Gammaproteobacteria bacterium]
MGRFPKPAPSGDGCLLALEQPEYWWDRSADRKTFVMYDLGFAGYGLGRKTTGQKL